MRWILRGLVLVVLVLVMTGPLVIWNKRIAGVRMGAQTVWLPRRAIDPVNAGLALGLLAWLGVEIAARRRPDGPVEKPAPEKEYFSPVYETPAMHAAIGTGTVVHVPEAGTPAAPVERPPAPPVDEGSELERAVAFLDTDAPAAAILILEGLQARAFNTELVSYYLAIAYGANRQPDQVRAVMASIRTDALPVQRKYKLACMLEEARLFEMAQALYKELQGERRRFPDVTERLARVRDILFDGGPEAFDRQLISLLNPRYREPKVLASGGMGVVFTAHDSELGTRVAIKMLSPLLRNEEQAAKRFMREAQVLMEMAHPNLVKTFAVHAEPCPHYSMEFLEGRTLQKVIQAGAPLPLNQIRKLSEQMLAALDYCHQRRIVHRDIKPANVLVPDASPLKIIDFGLVRSAMSTSITVEGTVMGTPPYMPPEQLAGEEVDETADLYSFGVVLYEMSTGKLPFPPGESMTRSIATGKYEPATTLRADLPPLMDQVIGRLIHRDRRERPVRAAKVAEALAKVLPA